jgi:uncharacterized protein
MQNFFIAMYSYINQRKFISLILFLCLALLLVFFASKIQFSEDITRLIPRNDKTNTTAKVLSQLDFADKITIKISSQDNGTPDDLSEVATVFLEKITTNCEGYVAKVQGRFDDENLAETFDFVYNNLPLFLDKTDYNVIQNKLQNDSVTAIVESNYKSLIAPTGIVSRDFILKDPLGISFMALKKMQQLSIGDDFELQNGFVVTKDKKNLLLFITPKLPTNETDKNTFFVQQLNNIKAQLNTKYRGKAILSFYGATPVAVGNATQIKSDVQWTSIFAGCALIFILTFFYRNLTTPIIIFIPSFFGAAFALSVLFFTKGSISAISLGISSILLGETTDYSIYVLTHLRNNKNIKLLYKDITKPLLLCGITTGITFLCLFFVKSEALKDLGIFAALSVMSTTIFSLVLIPLLYKSKKESTAKKSKLFSDKKNWIDTLAAYNYHQNKFLVIAMMVLLVVCLFTYSKVTFNNDLASLNFVSSELKQTERELETITNGDAKSIYLATYGDSYETVLKNNNLLFETLKESKRANEIVKFSSIGGLVFSDLVQQQKVQDWTVFWNQNKKTALKSKLIAYGSTFGFKANSYNPFYKILDKKFETVQLTDYFKVKSFFIEEFVSQKKGFFTISTLVKVTKEKRDAFVNTIKRQPNLVVIDRQQTNETFLGSLKENFEKLIEYSFVAVFFILFFAFRRLELVIVSIIPIAISWIFTTGLMGIFHLQFNVINIIVCTLIFGIGVDYSIFMTSALQKQHTYGKMELPTYRTSIMLSVATTILGIGVLVFAKHPALQSISIIAIIGIFSALLITFIIQPLVFNFFVTNRVKKGQPPFEIKKLIHSTLSFIYYGLGGFLLSIVSVVLMKILPFSKKTVFRDFHIVLSKFMHSVLMTYPSNKRTVINTQQEDFERQAVIIANHSSFLDILAIGRLSPKIIFLVSDWVYNSPIFGKGVRLAGFYPVSNGIDNGVEHLRTKVEQGYSLMVFPEGTRSVDNNIKRFHKGAFFLAEQFQLDIVPIVIHGYAEILPKGDFMINGGKTSVEILKRITPDDPTFGLDYNVRTKKISAFFKEHYKKMRLQIEDPYYFKKALYNSFDYKEPVLLKAIKENFELHAVLYHQLNGHIGEKAKILHIADDYGQCDVLLTLQQAQRKITSYIADAEKRGVAKTNYFINKRALQYIDDVKIVLKDKYDVILLSNKNAAVSIEELTEMTNEIILCGTILFKNSILERQFIVAFEEKNIVVLKKKIE